LKNFPIRKVGNFEEQKIFTMKNYWLILILALSFSCKKTIDIPQNENITYEPKSSGEIVKHTYYTLAYSEENEEAFWVYYQLTPENINGTQARTEDFRPDPLVSTVSASLADYAGSGYDRGHLCPAADMKQNQTAMSETFFLSNMTPQIPGFNRGIWSTLEAKVRAWALQNSKIYVVTGPVFKSNLGVIGADQVTVSGFFYKVIYDGKNKMIGLILPHASSTLSLDHFVVKVDDIELQTGIDFFPQIEDQLENQLEGEINTTNWSF